MPIESGIKVRGVIIERNKSADPGEFTALIKPDHTRGNIVRTVYHAGPSEDDTDGRLYLSLVPALALESFGLERALAISARAFIAELGQDGSPYEILFGDRVGYFQHVSAARSTFFIPEMPSGRRRMHAPVRRSR